MLNKVLNIIELLLIDTIVLILIQVDLNLDDSQKIAQIFATFMAGIYTLARIVQWGIDSFKKLKRAKRIQNNERT